MLKALTFLKSLALLLALMLAIQDFGSFFIERPTSAVLTSNKLTVEKFPDAILCPYPGYDFEQLQRHGFKGFDGYLFGIMEGEEGVVNFNGKLGSNPANISEDIVLVKNLGDIVHRIEATIMNDGFQMDFIIHHLTYVETYVERTFRNET